MADSVPMASLCHFLRTGVRLIIFIGCDYLLSFVVQTAPADDCFGVMEMPIRSKRHLRYCSSGDRSRQFLASGNVWNMPAGSQMMIDVPQSRKNSATLDSKIAERAKTVD